ncbi:hypothetical protein NM688_g3972 [Phlebia brevispora]|uniref:Uncharacterized protein n=1 Tax=Phlebia brevispora TaxID=194682 RepID=A0ACC1T4F3_9APHY|nr:hypothetical protein NM688_g3972 [Phlebia brevispora]
MYAILSNSDLLNVYEPELTDADYSYAVLVYEYVITFQHEYELLWQPKWTPATWLFLFNRYTLLERNSACYAYQSAMFSAMRVFALLRHAYIAAGAVFVLGIPRFGIAFTQYRSGIRSAVYHTDNSALVSLALTLVTITSDVVAIALTWLKTYRHVKQAAAVGVNSRFGATLIQYGTLHFIALLVPDLVNLFLLITPSGTEVASGVNIFLSLLPNIVISRFLINLRQVDFPGHNSTSHFSHFSAPNLRISTTSVVVRYRDEHLTNSEGQEGHDQEHDTEFCGECPDELWDGE